MKAIILIRYSVTFGAFMATAESVVHSEVRYRSRSTQLVVVDGLLFVIFASMSIWNYGSLAAIMSGGFALLCLVSGFSEWRGIRAKAQQMSLPYRPLPFFPILVLGTRSILFDDISELTSIGRWFGL
jgi:hypothetical protein